MSKECATIHNLTQKLPRHSFPFDESNIPLNGIYLLFQKGEKAHGQDRVVRVGTHNGENRLYLRLKEHFLTENKDRSIFRKNIGRCLLNKTNDQFLELWNKDLTSKKARGKFAITIDAEYKQQIEEKVSNYIQDNFSFVVLEVAGKENRLSVETNLISTISLCTECTPSSNWLGLYAPPQQKKIKESGLWQVKNLYKHPFDTTTFNEFRRLL